MDFKVVEQKKKKRKFDNEITEQSGSQIRDFITKKLKATQNTPQIPPKEVTSVQTNPATTETIRITSNGQCKIKKIVEKVTACFKDNGQKKEHVLLCAKNNQINKLISITELLKRSLAGMHIEIKYKIFNEMLPNHEKVVNMEALIELPQKQ